MNQLKDREGFVRRILFLPVAHANGYPDTGAFNALFETVLAILAFGAGRFQNLTRLSSSCNVSLLFLQVAKSFMSDDWFQDAYYSKGIKMARILLIDDEQHIRERFSSELAEGGYYVSALASCCHLRKRIELFKPDLIVLDIKLVDCDGFEVLEEIRNSYPDLPVILWSAYDSYQYDIRSIAADYYVLKSFDLSELKKRIVRSLEAAVLPKLLARSA
jgi:CheY-like chemotaxis protein